MSPSTFSVAVLNSSLNRKAAVDITTHFPTPSLSYCQSDSYIYSKSWAKLLYMKGFLPEVEHFQQDIVDCVYTTHARIGRVYELFKETLTVFQYVKLSWCDLFSVYLLHLNFQFLLFELHLLYLLATCCLLFLLFVFFVYLLLYQNFYH
jgi:hypothetical protein